MSTELQKLAADLPAVLTAAAEHLEKMAGDHAAVIQENDQLIHELSAHKLARRLEQRGLSSELDYEAKVAKLLEMPVEKLASMDEAIELASGGFRLGSVETDEKTASEGSQAGGDPLDTYIASNAAFT
jgi:hypothetical protein